MTGPDVAGVLAAEITQYLGAYTLPANYSQPLAPGERHWDVAERCGPQIAAHVAAAVNAEVARWLTDMEASDRKEGTRGGSMALLIIADALSALAEQLACVDPSPSESGSTDPEVRQSADRTSTPARGDGGGS